MPLQTGLPLRITSRAFPERVFDGTLEKIGDTLDPATRTVKVRGVVSNPDKLLKAEMYVLVDIVQDTAGRRAPAWKCRQGAIFARQRLLVFLEESPGQFQRHKVKVGVRTRRQGPRVLKA